MGELFLEINGELHRFELHKFPDADRDEFGRRWLTDFVDTNNALIRRHFMVDVLYYARLNGTQFTPKFMGNADISGWTIFRKVFIAVLEHNGIDLRGEEKWLMT